MKNNILNGTGLLALAASLWLLPQSVDAQIRFGAAIGLNYTDIDDVDFGSTTAVYDSRQGYHIGVFADIPVGPLGVRPGVFYMNAGKIFESGLGDFIDEVVDDPDLQFDDDFEVEYITIPIDVRYRFGLGPVLPYLFLGPELRFRTETDLIEEVDDNLKSFGVAGNLGAGVEVSLLGVKLLPEFRMAFDTSGIIDDEITIGDFEFVADEAHQLRTVMLRLGVIF
ncbi:MAG TPA: porin family protein [Rhodothermia bacterium]|nr:porin family protein [Rhodothermia bacterium]